MPGRILVVDDVATNRIILKVKLSSSCYEILQAGGGAEALLVAQRDHPDLILLDIGMPDIDGLEVCRRLKADPRTADIPVIVVTGRDDLPSKLAALAAGAEDFLSKPLDEMALLARIRSLLRARSIASELALREGTSQALGFAEPAAGFEPPGRICLVDEDEARSLAWKRQLRERLHDSVEICSRAGALAPGGSQPDLFLIPADLGQPGGGLLLLSELRSRQETRHAGILIAVDREDHRMAAMALDLGASDLVTMPVDLDELELRLKAILTRKRQSDRLRRQLRDGLQLAVTDPLTGLYNRRYAMSHLARVQERAIAAGKSFAVMLVDLDRFKVVNDTFGHSAGDHVLKTVAGQLAANLRNVDLVARIGGEEFLVILPDVTADGAGRAAERLREAVAGQIIELPGLHPDEPPTVLTQTVSIGVATGNVGPEGHEERSETLLDRADRALYRSKTGGRNLVTLENPTRAAA